MNNKKFELYNHTSENMPEVKDKSIDLIVGSVPYNIGTKYDQFEDSQGFEAYKSTMRNVIQEVYRTLKSNGTFVIESADSILSGNRYIQLAGFLEKISLETGFYLKSRHFLMVNTNDYLQQPEHGQSEEFVASGNTHSNAHQWLVLIKEKQEFVPGSIFYFNYECAEGHPCPSPKESCTALLDMYFKQGTVLDPFCGTARLGEETIKRNGRFVGYDISKKFIEYAKERMMKYV